MHEKLHFKRNWWDFWKLKISGTLFKCYVLEYQKFVLKWYERDRFLPYYDQLKYKEFSDNLVILLLDVQVVNFDFMHHQRRGDSLQGSVQNHKAVSKRNFKRYLKQTKTKAVIAALKNYWVI